MKTRNTLLSSLMVVSVMLASCSYTSPGARQADVPQPTTQVASTSVPDKTANPTAAPTTETVAISDTVPSYLSKDGSHGAWKISLNAEISQTDPIVANWLSRIKDPAPASWMTFPNIPNKDVKDFNVAAGAEYGVDNVPYCQQDQRCDLPVPAWHYRLVTGDFKFLGKTGNLLLVVNVMDKTFTWRDVTIDNGFTTVGRYWDGDKLEWATWGIISHAAANMLNMPTMASPDKVLNAGNPGNGGANCGNVNGCQEVKVVLIVHAGDRILAIGETTVTR